MNLTKMTFEVLPRNGNATESAMGREVLGHVSILREGGQESRFRLSRRSIEGDGFQDVDGGVLAETSVLRLEVFFENSHGL